MYYSVSQQNQLLKDTCKFLINVFERIYICLPIVFLVLFCRGESKLKIFNEIYLSWFELPYFWETKALLCMSERWWWCCDMTNDSYQVVRKSDGRCSVAYNHLLKQQTKLYYDINPFTEITRMLRKYMWASINVKIEFWVHLIMNMA